jgi:hypothetical protein
MVEFLIIVICTGAILYLILKALAAGWASFRDSSRGARDDDSGDSDESNVRSDKTHVSIKDRAA